MKKNWVAVMIIGFVSLALILNFFYTVVAYGVPALSPADDTANFSLLILLFGIFLVAVFLIGVFFQRDWENTHKGRKRRG